MTDHPTRPTNFRKYIGTKIQRYVLPIIPVGVKLTAKSKLTADHLGKIPGLVSDNGEWAGFPWPESVATEGALAAYESWQAEFGVTVPLAVRTGDFIVVIDLDIENEIYLNAVRALAEQHFGVTPVVRRRDRSIRCVLVYRHKAGTAPIRKFAGAYKDEQGQKQLVEVLGTGCLSVLEGPHAKGAMHYWEGDRELVDNVEELPEITVEQVSAFYVELDDVATTAFGYVKHKLSLPSGGDSNRPTFKVADPESPNRAKDLELLVQAMQAIDLDAPEMDYDAFIKLLRAICAASGGSLGFLHDVVWPWVCTNQTEAHGEGPRTEEQGIEWLEARWVSFTDSQLGVEHVYKVAASFGFGDGIAALTQEIMKAAPPLEPLTADEGDAGSDGGGVAGPGDGSGGSGVSTGPTAFPFTDTALTDLFVAQHPDYRYTPDQGWVRLDNGLYVPDQRILEPIKRLCSSIGDPYRSQGAQGVKVDIALKGHRTHQRVEGSLRSTAFADPAEFDTEAWLLNTPSGIVDLRDGNVLPHGMLMRNQTLVAPNFFAMIEGYEAHCPRWWGYLNFIADNRDFVIPFLQRWGGASLVGAIFELYFLFIHGLSGTGKTVYLDVLSRICHLYGTPVSKGFFMRVLEKRTFELYQTFKKRAVFSDEVPKGSTWDEMMLLTMLNGSELHAEGKGKAFLKFRSVASITITGNHRPAFVTSSEESGIDRRLLLLECNKKIAEHMPDNTRFAQEVVEEEGAAILAFFIEGAMQGWQSLQTTGSFFGDIVKPLVAAAKGYRRAANPFLQWVKEEMDEGEGEGFDYEAQWAFKAFVTYMREQNPKYHILKEDFRNGMEMAGFKYDRRTLGKVGIGRMVFLGIRPKQDVNSNPFGGSDSKDSKVVPFPTPTSKLEK